MAQKFTVPITLKNLSSSGSDGITVFLDQEAYARVKLEAGGRLVWGNGAGAGDVNLYRDTANALKTDDAFQAVSGLITLATSGSPTVSLADGALAVDTAHDKFYFRSNSAWQEVTAGGGGGGVGYIDGGAAGSIYDTPAIDGGAAA
jgi:pantoate kinase